ncbi:MAG: uroporphyrinogen-III synthase [Shimia sp.]
MDQPLRPFLCLVTRPRAQAEAFAARVRAELGVRTLVAPVLRIEAVEAAVPDGVRGIVLTSQGGARALPRLGVARDVPCHCVGRRTAQAAREAGHPARALGGDAGALVDALLAAPPPGPLVHVRGRHSRGAVAARLTAGGLPCTEAVAYDQVPEPLSPEAVAALRGAERLWIPLFSPRSAALLTQHPPPAAPAVVFALSQAVVASSAWRPPRPHPVAPPPPPPARLGQLAGEARLGNRRSPPRVDGGWPSG